MRPGRVMAGTEPDATVTYRVTANGSAVTLVLTHYCAATTCAASGGTGSRASRARCARSS